MSTTGAWKDLKNNYESGGPTAGIPAEDLVKIANVLNTLKVINGTLVKTPDGNGWTLKIGGFSGIVWQAGFRKTVSGTPAAYVKVPLDGSNPTYVATYVDGDANNEYYEVDTTFGDIHESRS